ncbi:MAG: T9SS type A sorting domain-containing protein [Desulfobacula sp.]|nr:T9SS type A sorting domain-containing protein [Desulfobacula sp.]
MFYQVGGFKPDGCFPTKMKKSISNENYTLSFTNVEDNVGSGIGNINYLNKVKVYPNPFTNKTLIEFPNPNLDNYKLIITNISGKIVRIIDNIRTNKVEFEKGVLSEGFYLIELRGEKVYRSRFIIK